MSSVKDYWLEAIKEETAHNTKGNCLLNAVVGFYRPNSRGPLSCQVWIISRSSEVFTKFGADLYFTQTILYRESWLPFWEDLLKLWKETENAGD